MKIAFEKIDPDIGSSFKLIHWKSENDTLFWHQHPEYEIIYVKKAPENYILAITLESTKKEI